MKQLVDYHLHSCFSPDSHEEIAAICRRALELGLAEICLTDHADFDPREWNYKNYKYEAIRRQIAQARARFGNPPEIRLGVELSYQSDAEDEIRRFLEGKEFDLVLGSVHLVDRLLLDQEVFPTHLEEEATHLYFQELLRGVRSGLFDVVAHLDLVKRYSIPHYGSFRFQKYRAYYEEILRAMVEGRVGLEVNTSGLRQAPREPYPGLEAIRLYRQLGGELITLGSDAHRAEHVGYGLQDGLVLLEQAGFRAIALYRGRKPFPLELSRRCL